MEGWAERVGELEAEMNRCQVAHSAMLQDVANKDERIMVFILILSPEQVPKEGSCFCYTVHIWSGRFWFHTAIKN